MTAWHAVMRALLASLCGLIAVSASAQAAVTESLRHAPYTVRGESVGDVRADISSKQPSKGFDGRTTWNVRWDFRYQPRGSGCSVVGIAIKLDIVIIVPRLETGNEELAESFAIYSRALMEHEMGHAETARGVARRIDAGIAGLTAATCPELVRKANDLGHAIVREGNAEDVAYDARTGHGDTQGARWPRRLPPQQAPAEEAMPLEPE